MFKPSLFFLTVGIVPAMAIPAFPGAEGYGANANGGRGGDVYHVTNLNASGAGSFAEGIASVPTAGRTIVFDVSGYIRLPSGSNGTRMTSSKVTIAGQTAPGDGIGFYNNFFRISGDDVVIRHLRFRHGKYGSGGDCIDLDSGCLNAILDHVSMQFSTDENMSSFGSPPENITLQYSLNAWGLESHSCGGLWDQNHATSHHNLWAHNHTRNPKARPGGLLEWVNNVTFDWDIGFIMGDSESVQNWKANVINNYFVCPPGNTQSKALVKGSVATNNLPNFTVFLAGNLTDNNGDGILNGTDKGYSIVEGSPYSASEIPAAAPGAFRYYQSPSAITGSTVGVTTDAPLVAYKKIVSNAGALRLDANYTGAVRDEVDTILMSKLTTQARFHVTREADTGASASGFGVLNSSSAPVDTDRDGMPDYYETALGWNGAAQDHNTALANSGGLLTGTTFFPTGTVSGYTRLEEYLQFLAIPHATVAKNVSGTPTSIQIDLRKFTSGFANGPAFALSNVTNGTTTATGAGGYLVTFTPTPNFVGRGRFEFTVTDADGSAWTQAFGLLVSQGGLPRDLNWKGDGASNTWDMTAENWLLNGAVTSFSGGDRVTFDDSGSFTPAVGVPVAVAPATVVVNAAGNHTMSGAGAINSSGTLTKRGAGSLTINNTGPNSFSSVSLDEGLLSLGNFNAAGSGKMSLNGGSLFLSAATANSLEFNAPTAITVGSQQTMTGNWTGSKAVTINGTSNHLWSVSGTWTGFTGAINFGTGNVRMRMNGGTSNSMFGSAGVKVNLGSGTSQLMNRNGSATTSFDIGSLESTGSGTVLSGTQTGTINSTYSIGALNTSTTFAGSIVNGGGVTNIAKVGTGALTLAGASTYTGTTGVKAGTLIVSGSLGGTGVTVSSGATLAGGGTIGGSVTSSSGSFLSPATEPFTGGTMTLNGGLTLNGGTLYFDMSNSAAGTNDKIVMGGGTLTMSGTQTFQFLLLQNTLTAGNYDLITGATSISPNGYTLAHNLPAGARQTFSLAPVGTTLRLTVTGDPATLTWTGANSANWDTTTAGNWTGAAPDVFGTNDAVVIDDSSAVTTIALPAPVIPRSTLVNNSSRAFTIAGGINGGTLTKSGTNTLTLSGANPFDGGLTLNAGTIVLGSEAANADGLGTGRVTMNSGVISMRDDSTTYNDFNADLVVPGGATARLNADSRVDMYGTLGGAGTLNFYVPFSRTTLFTNWSAFTGTINVLTDSDGGEFRMGTSYGYPGFPNAALVLADKVYLNYTGTLASGGGTTIDLGEVGGTSQSHLRGGATGGRALTYRVGGRNTNATFAGFIEEQNTGTATNFVKVGSGTWTLSGGGLWYGGTTVSEGGLAISGNITSTGAVGVSAGAGLTLVNGTITTDAVTLAGGSSFNGYGNLNSDLVCGGTLIGRGFSSGTAGILHVTGSAFFDANSQTRLRGGDSSDLVAVSGDLSLAGTVQIGLAAGSTFGRYPLFTYGGNLSMDAVSLTGISNGTVAKLSTRVAGRVDLVIDDSDEDGLPDSWENEYFGSLGLDGPADPDGDGQDNAIEYLAGTNPASGASRFAATLTPLDASQFALTWPSVPGKSYQIQKNEMPGGTWNLVTSISGAAAPATVTNYTVNKSAGKMFYRVALVP